MIVQILSQLYTTHSSRAANEDLEAIAYMTQYFLHSFIF